MARELDQAEDAVDAAVSAVMNVHHGGRYDSHTP